MHRPRDSRRKKLYTAERQITRGREFDNFDDVVKFVRKVENSYTFELLGKKCETFAYVSPMIHVDPGRRHWDSARAFGRHEIVIPKWAWCERIILHELTHMLIPNTHPAHGPLFAKVFAHLVSRFLGKDALKELKRNYKKHGVKYAIRYPSDGGTP